MTGRQANETDETGYDDYSRYEQARSKKSSDPGVARYEVARPSLKSLQANRKGKFLFVYKNFKPKDKAFRVPFSRRKYPHMESLLDEITRINKTTVRYLFKWPTGEEVYDTGEIEDDDDTLYVCSTGRNLDKQGKYGGQDFGGGSAGSSAFLEKYSRNSYDSRRSEKPSPIQSHGSRGGGQININVISNTNRDSKQSLFFNPRGTQQFEDILKSIQGMLIMEYPPCKSLVSVTKPFKKVESISSLKRVIQQYGDNTFWACGREGDPYEKLGTPDGSPVRNGQPSKKTGPKQNGQQRDDRMRQSNGQAKQPERFGQYEDDDEEMEDFEPEQRDISPQRNSNNNNTRKKQNDNRQSQNRQSKRYDEEDDTRNNHGMDDPRGHREQPRGQEDEEDTQKKEDTPRKQDRRGNKRDASEDRNDRKQNRRDQRRGSTPSPRRNSKQNDDDNNSDDDRDDDHPSEEEMEKRIEKMERPKSGLDDDIRY